MRYRVNVIVRRRGAPPDAGMVSRQLPDGYETVEAALQAAETVAARVARGSAFVTIRVMDGFTAVYVSERAWP